MLHSPGVHPFPAPLAARSARAASDGDRPDRLGVPAITWLLVIFALLALLILYVYHKGKLDRDGEGIPDFLQNRRPVRRPKTTS